VQLPLLYNVFIEALKQFHKGSIIEAYTIQSTCLFVKETNQAPKKTVQGSLAGAEFDVGDLRLCRFWEFVDGLHRDDVVVKLNWVERYRCIL